MTTASTTDFVLAAGQALNSTNEDALLVTGSSWSTVSIQGRLALTAATNMFPVYAIRLGAENELPRTLTVAASGSIVVHSTTPQGSAGAIAAGGASGFGIKMVNLGLIQVRSSDVGSAVSAAQGGFENRGAITVSAVHNAGGVSLEFGGAFLNTGAISVAGGGGRFAGVVGVSAIQTTTADAMTNTGTIRVTANDALTMTRGIVIGGFVSLTNSGLVEADRALEFVRSGILTGGGRGADITNSGTLRGQVFLNDLTGEPITLRNTGEIEGAVTLNNGADTYNGAGGVVSGLVSGSDGSDSLMGGAGAETLQGDAGNDTIDGGTGGADLLDGGVGTDTLSFGGSATAITLDVGLQTVSGGVRFSNFEQYLGSGQADTIRGSATGDTLGGGAGADTINGGAGDDRIDGGSGQSYLRGDEGNDSIVGGDGFDDINGNMGNDTASGGVGEDWVVGGKDNDLLFGDGAYDLVYGNLGNDTCEGGEGNDIVRGGQDNDAVLGGAGDDFVSGDKGDDTMTGGTGADIFHTFGQAGIDRVTDFNRPEGDRVQVDPGTVYMVSQVGADTVIDMTGGGKMILVGVAMSSLTGAWIVGA